MSVVAFIERPNSLLLFTKHDISNIIALDWSSDNEVVSIEIKDVKRPSDIVRSTIANN